MSNQAESQSSIYGRLSSFMVTGASASGKTTLINTAIRYGYKYIPTHMTRPARPDETDGIHGVFIDEQSFEERFRGGEYLEPSLDFARLHSLGIYYGTSVDQMTLLSQDRYCSSPVSVAIARVIFDYTGVKWLHLVCDPEERKERLLRRGLSHKEVGSRMRSGDSVNVPDGATVLSTSQMRPLDILKLINSTAVII